VLDIEPRVDNTGHLLNPERNEKWREARKHVAASGRACPGKQRTRERAACIDRECAARGYVEPASLLLDRAQLRAPRAFAQLASRMQVSHADTSHRELAR
jgi:hypothetical protein